MKKITIYGIPNCDTVKKTFDWFKKKKVDFDFHDYKKSGISKEKLNGWSDVVGWEKLLNKNSTTWKELPASVQEKITSQSAAIKLMMENTSSIKRPVIEYQNELVVGYNETEFARIIA